METAPAFGQWLKRRRYELDLTQEALADAASCSPDTIRKIESGKRRPSQQVACMLAAIAGVEPDGVAAVVQWARGRSGAPPWLAGAASPTYQTLQPAERTGPLASTALPRTPTAFIGREALVATVRHAIYRSTTRLVTLTGPGGTGKTRLAIEIAASLRDDFLDGVVFVDLVPIDSPALVTEAIAGALGVRGVADRPLLAVLKEYLWDRRLLLLIDNFEHLLPAADIVADLIQAATEVKFLVTSRAALHLRGEKKIEVPPLGLSGPWEAPEPGTPTASAESEAVALFAARAQDEQSDFVLTPDNAGAISNICARLDGLPLAIELAAARLNMFSPQDLLARLEHRLPLLTGGLADLPPRQQTLRSTIAWSYNLLPAREQTLFAQLDVFRGGCTLEAAEAVCGSGDVLEPLALLVRSSVVRKSEGIGGAVRYGMLATIAEFAHERLVESEKEPELWRRHALYYMTLAEAAEPHVRGGPEQVVWLDRLEVEHDNLRAALDRTLGSDNYGDYGDYDVAARLATALVDFWTIRGYAAEGHHYLEAIVSSGEELTPRLLNAAGRLARAYGDDRQAISLFEQALEGARARKERWEEANALAALGAVISNSNEVRAHLLAGEALRIREEVGDRLGAAVCLYNLADIALDSSDPDGAQRFFTRALEISREMGDARQQAIVLQGMGRAEVARSDYNRAHDYMIEALELLRTVGDKRWSAGGLYWLADLLLRQGEYERALALDREAIELYRSIGNQQHVSQCLQDIALATACLGDYRAATRVIEESMELGLRSGHIRLLGWGHTIQGIIARWSGDNAKAEELSRKAIDLFGQLNYSRLSLCFPLLNLGYLAAGRGDLSSAGGLLGEALEILWESGDKGILAWCLGAVLGVANQRGDGAATGRLYGAMQSICETTGAAVWAADRAPIEAWAAQAAALGEAEFQRAVLEGRSMPAAEAVEVARAVVAAAAEGRRQKAVGSRQ